MLLETKNLTITLSRDDRVLLQDFSFALNPGDRCALIGEEGNGKSTLLKFLYDPALVEGYCEVTGTVRRAGQAAYLPQMLPEEWRQKPINSLFDKTLLRKNAALLASLGLTEDFLLSGRLLSSLSGGEKVKVQLCRLLLDAPDYLLLDEPTNDLDIETLTWLEGFLLSTPLPVLYISHDETLLARTATCILHLEQLIRKTQPRMTIAHQGYEEYLNTRHITFAKQGQVAQKQRDDARAQQEKWQKIHDKVERDQRNISRQDPHGGQLLKKKMKAVQSMGRRFEREREEFTDYPEEETAILTRFDPGITLPAGKTVVDYALPELRAGGKVLSRNVRLLVNGCEHIGITGRNGAGKSTLLSLLWDEMKSRRDITCGLMPQDYDAVLDGTLSPVAYLTEHYDKEKVTRARTCLGSMRFTHEEMTNPIACLSGGQKAKLLLLDMVLKGCNVLLLDEPTRNFSPLSCPVVREALRDFGGAMISVSHDRRYLQEVCGKVYVLDESGLHLQK